MTHVINALNVNEAFVSGIWWLRTCGQIEQTRNGPCIVAPGPVVTEYLRPYERVLWDETRDANPVFHLVEALWMLSGSRDAATLTTFNKRMSEYAEVDGDIHGAYGYRWRINFGFDQIQHALNELSINPNTRRAVVAMWDPLADMDTSKRDIPCNTHIYFDRREGRLNMTVCCRSNDLLWGAYGANVVHFSILQELMALALRIPVGVYRQFSNNFHVYTEVPQVKALMTNPPVTYNRHEDPYGQQALHLPLLATGELYRQFIDDCVRLVSGGGNFETEFFNKIVSPLVGHYIGRKMGLHYPMVVGYDWGLAYQKWLNRREKQNVV